MYLLQLEICVYLECCIDEFGVCLYVCFYYELMCVMFDEVVGVWNLEMVDGCCYCVCMFIFGMGGLSCLVWLNIFGIEIFQGKVFYLQFWEYDYDLCGKCVVVIGIGVLVIQFVLQIVLKVGCFDLYQCMLLWILFKFDCKVLCVEYWFFCYLLFM